MTMNIIPAGSFRMGDPQDSFSNAPLHQVALSKPFFISDREVSVAQFRQFTSNASFPPDERLGEWEGENSRVSPTNTCPVQQVSWFDAVKFCNWLSRQEGRTPCYSATSPTNWVCDLQANGYRLPTEAEWECACHAVSESAFAFGDDEKLLGEYAWYTANSSSRTWPAGSKLPNLWGAFDLPGNVWEWCQDWYAKDYYGRSPKEDPPGPQEGDIVDVLGTEAGARGLRGGSWFNGPANLRSACRDNYPPVDRNILLGFRCVLVGASSP